MIFSRIKHRAVRLTQKRQGKQVVHFLHIGKTGGSAIKYVVKRYSISARYTIRLHPHGFGLRDVPEGERVIFFLRDPISRFISGFYSRQRRGQPRYFSPWSLDEKIAFEEFSTPNQLAIALSSKNADENARAQSAMKSIEHVRDSFWNWFGSREYFISRMSDIFFIGFQERLTGDFEILKLKLDLPGTAELPKDEFNAHRNPADLEKTLTAEAVLNLQRWYKADFEFIDLCKEITEHQKL